MRIVGFTGLALVTALALAPRPSAAAYYYPWCAQYQDRSSVRSCAFATFEQCRATVSGVGGFCIENAVPPPPQPYAEYRRPKPRHRHVAHNS
jgi:Protein of unknown function (DUF3551)